MNVFKFPLLYVIHQDALGPIDFLPSFRLVNILSKTLDNYGSTQFLFYDLVGKIAHAIVHEYEIQSGTLNIANIVLYGLGFFS